VRLKDAALVAAAVLSHRYIADRFLPDKAIDLGGRGGVEAAHGDRLDAGGADEVSRRIMQLEIEREALRKETDAASQDRLTRLERELAELKEARTRWRRGGRTRSRPSRPPAASRSRSSS